MTDQYKNLARQKAIEKVMLFMENYWIIKDETPEYFLLKKNEASLVVHILIAVVLGWWMFYIPNIIYHLMMNRKRKIFKYS